jgi:hypothetical protein
MESKLFSERHDKAIREKRLKIPLRHELRRSLYRLMDRYSVRSGWDGEDNMTFDSVQSNILERRGWESLLWWDGKKMQPAGSFYEFIEKGVPYHVLDAIELFRRQLDYKKAASFLSELNTIFDIHHSQVRYFQGDFYLIDSSFIESQVAAQAQELLQSTGFQGALQEFSEARASFMDKDFKRTILMSNHALESTLKAILGIERKKTSELIRRICNNEFVPAYYEGFLNQLRGLLEIVPAIRTNEAGHGQGKAVTQVPPAVAEFALHLSGSLIVFLIKRHMERNPIEPEDESDLPF